MIKNLQIGKIINTHGLKGELKIMPLTDDPSRYDDLDWVYVDMDFSNSQEKLLKVYIEQIKYFKETVILKIKGIDDIENAEKLKGLFLKIPRDMAVKLQKDNYFICDIIGCSVFDETGSELGIIQDILKTGSNDVYVVKSSNSKELLIPALKSIVKNIDLEKKQIIVVLPEGLV